MKKVIIMILLVSAIAMGDYPKPTFTVNAYHFDRLHNPQAFDIVLLSDVLLEEEDVERFWYKLKYENTATIFPYAVSDTGEQFCKAGYIYPNDNWNCGEMVELPCIYYAGLVATVEVVPEYYDRTGTLQLVFCLPDLYYEEVVSELVIDSIYDYQGGICGDGLHPYPLGDINKDCVVNLEDWAIIAENWLACTHDCD